MMQEKGIYYNNREKMARLIFSWLLLILIFFYFNHSLLFQLQEPVLIYPESDNSFWLLHIFRFPQLIIKHHWFALAFDIFLIGSVIYVIIVPGEVIFNRFVIIGLWISYICYCSAAGKHYAQIGYLLAPIPFLAIEERRFNLLWEGLRYWICFLYLSAGVYKIYYGGFGYIENMSHILQQENATWFIFNQHGIQADTIRYLIIHPGIAHFFFRLTTIIDLSLLIGFFTRRFDRWLLLGLILFHLGNLYLLHISFVEQSLIFAPFLPWENIIKD
jgi:hypothetical protein